ncbi:MAG TPA: alpha/beta hydrolase [Mycobacteriales bacterium]|jgi:pimeloyl-ACP methyl ester carboxylesterase|nr:alpha/beta hydrolase [Mycobacteriales bacterium]
MAEVRREWVSLPSPTSARAGHGSNPCQGLYHSVADRPAVAFIATHYNVDFAEHYLADYLAARGHGFLGWNTRFRGNEAFFRLEPALVDIGVGVRWLREVAGASRVVILGNSGGGSLMAAYQAQAADSGMPAADLYVSLNSHPGRPQVLTSWLDPSVVEENDPLSVDPSLDMFDPSHGPPYAPDFVDGYRAAQAERNHRITAWALAELDRLAAGGAWDRMFCVPRTWADLRFADLSLDPSDRRPGCYGGDPRTVNYSPFGLAHVCSLRSWLAMWSLAESECGGAPHLRRIGVPALVVQSTADRGVYPSDAREIHASLGSVDKSLEFLPGEHYFEDGGRDEVADLIAAWVADRG